MKNLYKNEKAALQGDFGVVTATHDRKFQLNYKRSA